MTYHVLSNGDGTILGVYGSALRDYAADVGRGIIGKTGCKVALHSIEAKHKPHVGGSISLRGSVTWL